MWQPGTATRYFRGNHSNQQHRTKVTKKSNQYEQYNPRLQY